MKFAKKKTYWPAGGRLMLFS